MCFYFLKKTFHIFEYFYTTALKDIFFLSKQIMTVKKRNMKNKNLKSGKLLFRTRCKTTIYNIYLDDGKDAKKLNIKLLIKGS